MSKLKDCPFCRGTAILVERTTALHNAGTVYCESCKCKMPSVLEWNKRPSSGMSIVKKLKLIRAVTERFCEIMDDQGHACSEECDCWKNCGCPETESLRDAIMKAVENE